MSSIHQIASGSATLAAETAGRGDPVIFLHAAIADRRMWREQLDRIGATHKAIAYDRRGFGETKAATENFSAVADLRAVSDALADGKPAILVGCSQGGRIAIDAALRHPSSVRGLVLISPTVTGAPEPIYPPAVKALMAELKDAEQRGDLDRVNAMKARIFLDGPFAPEGRVAGEARRMFLEMNGHALRSPPIGSDVDAAPSFPRLGELSMPALVICGDLDLPHIQERCRQIVPMMLNASHAGLTGTAHLPSLDRPAEVTRLLSAFVARGASGQ